MPYIQQIERSFILTNKGLAEFTYWLKSVPIEQRKGFLAYIIEYLTLYCFEKQNYFGRSTGLDALRSAYNELQKDLDSYEQQKRKENGDV